MNDSIAFKTSHFDFRGEKGRDKSLDTIPGGFSVRYQMTSKVRGEVMNRQHRAAFMHQERYRKEEEKREQVLRATDKTVTAPQPFRFRHDCEQSRVAETVKERRRFEPDVYNAGLATRPDFFRKAADTSKWVSPRRFVVSKGLPLHKISQSSAERNLTSLRGSAQRMSSLGASPRMSIGKRAPFTNRSIDRSRDSQDVPIPSLHFPSIGYSDAADMRGSSALMVDRSKDTYEPYNKVDVAKNNRGLGGNKKVRQLQNEYREKLNRSSMAGKENKTVYQAGVSMTTISSLGFREIPVERISIEDQTAAGRFIKKRKTHAPQQSTSRMVVRDADDRGSVALPPSMASNHLYGTFTKLQTITKAFGDVNSVFPTGQSLMSTRHISHM
jgi:hypothetical protein